MITEFRSKASKKGPIQPDEVKDGTFEDIILVK